MVRISPTEREALLDHLSGTDDRRLWSLLEALREDARANTHDGCECMDCRKRRTWPMQGPDDRATP